MNVKQTTTAVVVAIGAVALFATTRGQAQAPAAAGGRGGGATAPTVGSMLWPVFDANKDGSVTAAEIKAAFDAWYAAANAQGGSSVTQDQLGPAINSALGQTAAPAGGGGAAGGRGGFGGGGRATGPFVAGATTPSLTDACGARSQEPTAPCPSDVQQMEAILPRTTAVKAVKPHKVLIFSRIPSAGFQHSSIPLAAKAVEDLGKFTGEWTSDTSWDPAVFTTENLKQYDAIFLSSTTGCFLDMAPVTMPGETGPSDAARAEAKKTTDARRAAFIDFVRSGKGAAGIHATGDSYHGACPNDTPAAGGAGRGGGGGRGAANGPGGSLASVILRWNWGLDDKKLQADDLTLTKAEMDQVADAWYKELDPAGAGKITQADFMNAIVPVATQTNAYVGVPGRDNGRGSWPEWNDMIGGFFKMHWLDPQHIVVKIDDKTSPLTSMFHGQDFDVFDETYTFSVNSSFKDAHVLTSVNMNKMSFMDKLKEISPRPDHYERLSWIKKEGDGRFFYMALGHDERIYTLPAMMQHLQAGMQYVLGDLKADDTPTPVPMAGATHAAAAGSKAAPMAKKAPTTKTAPATK